MSRNYKICYYLHINVFHYTIIELQNKTKDKYDPGLR